jgi:hypothetical protein
MKDLSPRFCIPIDMPRPRGARLIEGFSPKLERRLQFFDHATFAVWIALEVTPDVISFCERPSRTGKDKGDPIVDFWVRRAAGEEFLFVPTSDTSVPCLDVCMNLPARTVTASERAAQSTWTANWMRMLPVINAARNALTKSALKSICGFVREPTSLAVIERKFTNGDPSVVRATAFELLRTGQLHAPELHTRPLSTTTLLEPTR